MSIKTVKINRWDGGVVNSARSKRSNVAKIISNAEVLKNPYRLTPRHDSERGATNEATDLMKQWCLAPLSGTYKLFGRVRQDASDKVRILYKHLTDDSTNDLSNDDWNETSSNTATQVDSTTGYNFFVYYARTGLIYGAHTGYIFTYDPTTPAFGDTSQAITYTFIGQGIVHSKDDNLYVPYYNSAGAAGAKSFIARKQGTATWELTALTLPDFLKPISICEFGNFLAIGCADVSGVGNSKVYLWDRNSSLSTLAENYDLPDGTLVILENLEGTLVAILQTSGNSSNGQAVNGVIRFDKEVLFQQLTPTGFKTIPDVSLQGTTLTVLINKQKLNSRLHFMMEITVHGARREGVWSIGKNQAGQWALVHERTPANDTATAAGVMRGFFYVGDYLFQAYINASSAHEVSKTLKTATYTNQTTIFESVINPNMPEEDLYKLKTPVSVTVRYVTLPSAGQVVLKSRTDSTTAWASITAAFTDTTDGSRVQEVVLNGATAFTQGREIEFRLESTGGAEILELIYSYEVDESNAK